MRSQGDSFDERTIYRYMKRNESSSDVICKSVFMMPVYCYQPEKELVWHMDRKTLAEDAAAFLDDKESRRQAKLDKKFDAATRDFRRIVVMIIEKYRPKKIYQWGSLLRRDRFSDISDIDIAVEGLEDSSRFIQLLSEADDMTDFAVDIVEMEHIDQIHADSIRKKGKVVYERSG